MCVENGKIKPERKIDYWLAPQNLLAISLLIGITLTILWNIFGYQHRLFDSAEQKHMIIDYVGEGHSLSDKEVADTKKHIYDKDVHQPYKDKLAEWYTRTEGKELEAEFKKMREKSDKLQEENLRLLNHILREVKRK